MHLNGFHESPISLCPDYSLINHTAHKHVLDVRIKHCQSATKYNHQSGFESRKGPDIRLKLV